MFGELMRGAVFLGELDDEWMNCLLEDLGAFGVQIDQWMIAAQDAGEWFKAVKQGVDSIMTNWIVAEKAEAKAALGHVIVIYSNRTGRIK